MRFEKLTIVKDAGRNQYRQQMYECLCDCGKTVTVYKTSLLSGNTKSCGCLRKQSKSKTHGRSKEPEYKIWQGMKGRCHNPNHVDYHNYGARGITVCEQWINDYSQFIQDMGNRPDGFTIERIDNEKGYSPSNCKWASRTEQNLNKRKYKPRTVTNR